MKRVMACLAILTLLSCRSTNTAKAPGEIGVTPPAAKTADSTTSATTPEFITHMRQLTFEGARAGEGYFSRDGRLMIFQSEREAGNPFYQMYVTNLETGATERVSPGNGKTTCGWIHPNSTRVLFASTHEDPQWKSKADAEYAERQHPKQRYSWNFDENFDIYTADIHGHHLKNLTHTKGYDAEGSYSPDGKWIAFASNRAGYDAKISPEDKKAFEKDPSYMMDIYIMRADGRDVKRLTTEPGYDGGPFFSPDGQHITFRHFAPDGRTAEIFTMKTDGSERRQLTHMGVMSWAPFYHTSGDYLIFASNKFGFGNFELFLVDTLGQHEPVRVTAMDGFDGLPVFSPDGRGLAWTHSNDKGEAQIYRAEWNDALARSQLGLPPLAPTSKTLKPAVAASDARAWVEYLASPYFGGRQTGNPKEEQYAQALAQSFHDMGLKPAMGDSYLQTYEFTSGIELGPKNQFTLNSDILKLASDWMPLSYSKTGTFEKAPLVFAGYGIVANATSAQVAYDSYANLDVKNKWVVVFSGLPESISNERRYFLQLYARLPSKALVAKQRGALGLIVIEDSQTPSPEMRLGFEGRSDEVGLPVVRVSSAVADRLFSSTGESRKVWTDKLAEGIVGSFAFNNQTVSTDVDLHLLKSQAHNVLAALIVPGAKSTVIVGAHLDHLGRGELGNSLATKKDQVHPGADDNASGVAGVMEVAALVAENARTHKSQLKQNILFALWTGEEIGILGSSYFAGINNKYALSASLNMDMIGRYRDALFVQGVGSAPEWKTLIERSNARDPLIVHTQEDPYLPSDALTFYMKKLPSIMLFTGSHPQYHTPQDTPDLINYEGLEKVAGFAERLTTLLASASPSLVTYRKVEGDPKTHPQRGFRLYLGTIPDYARELKNGVAITGTSKDSPAEKAGLISGDIILELGGVKINNLYDYVYCLQSLKANEKTQMRILRAGQEKVMDITPLNKTQ